MAHQMSQKKKEFLRNFDEIPVVSACCKRVGVSRATYYRWLENDSDFRKESSKAIDIGKSYVNDMAKSMLIQNIQQNQRWAIVYWLNNNDVDYMKPEKAKEANGPQFNSIHDLVVYATQNGELDD